MIAIAPRKTDSVRSYLATPERVPSQSVNRLRQQIHASYDAAGNSTEFQNYWAAADAKSADAANSHGVRRRLVMRSRYEVGSNGYADGICQTHANYLVSTGPTPRIATGNAAIDSLFKAEWLKWSKATQFRRKLWCMAHAKVQDGEAFAVIIRNPRVRHDIKLDLKLVECDQVHTPYLPYQEVGRIDGIHFDDYGNVIAYDILKQHPGGPFAVFAQQPDTIRARYVCHWFQMRRPGQHRGIPELTSTLQVGASSRRLRESVVAANEAAADFTVLLTSSMTPDESSESVSPMATLPIEKRMMVQLPEQTDAKQLEAKHPNAQYAEFMKLQIGEQGRPKSMPYNLSACDSSGHNYASGKLDREAYHMQLDVEREDGADLVLDKVGREFALEFELLYGLRPGRISNEPIEWGWPSHPVADVESEANAIDRRLRNGSVSPSRAYRESGEDYEAAVVVMAADYGVSVEEMRRALFTAMFNDRSQMASMVQAQSAATRNAQQPAEATA